MKTHPYSYKRTNNGISLHYLEEEIATIDGIVSDNTAKNYVTLMNMAYGAGYTQHAVISSIKSIDGTVSRVS